MLGCGGVGILSVYGAVGLLGSAAGARSVETHAGSAMSKSSLLTELSSCMCAREKERGEEEEVRELRIFCAQNQAHPPHYHHQILLHSISTQAKSSNLCQNKHSTFPVWFNHGAMCRIVTQHLTLQTLSSVHYHPSVSFFWGNSVSWDGDRRRRLLNYEWIRGELFLTLLEPKTKRCTLSMRRTCIVFFMNHILVRSCRELCKIHIIYVCFHSSGKFLVFLLLTKARYSK